MHVWLGQKLARMLKSIDGGLVLEPLLISSGGSPDARLLTRSASVLARQPAVAGPTASTTTITGAAAGAAGEAAAGPPQTVAPAAPAPGSPPLKVHLFPTFATQAEGSGSSALWTAHIHGWIFDPAPEVATNPEARWSAHRLSRELACRALGLRDLGMEGDVEGEGPRRVFRRRRKWLFRRTVAGRRVTLRLGNSTLVDVECDQMGHFKATRQLSEDELFDPAALDERDRDGAGTTGDAGYDAGRAATVEVVATGAPGRRGGASSWVLGDRQPPPMQQRCDDARITARVGSCLLVPGEGLSIISDIDDTIKITDVVNKRELIRNTFLREFTAVPGMAEVYRRWAADHAAVFHFVSASPWQLQPEIEAFTAAAGFPPATFHMKTLRLNSLPGSGQSLLNLFEKGTSYKPRHIDGIITKFPRRRFWLVGDSGEKDPETYGSIARQFQGQVDRILIRKVPGAANTAERFAAAFEGLPADRVVLFDDGADLAALS
eukprot:SAG22_NODE_565_length_9046_cov_142.250475_8_plen_491_part_00